MEINAQNFCDLIFVTVSYFIFICKFERIVSENVGVMLGLRAKLPTPPPEAVTVFMKTDGWKS